MGRTLDTLKVSGSRYVPPVTRSSSSCSRILTGYDWSSTSFSPETLHPAHELPFGARMAPERAFGALVRRRMGCARASVMFRFAGVAEVGETKFAKTASGGHVAYQVVGDGPVDVLVTKTSFPVDLMWDEPRLAHFLNRLSSFCRHIWFDMRGTGASDSIPHAEGRFVETVVDDMVAVIDDIGSERVALLAFGVPVGLLFAATHPERTTALVLVNASARLRRDDDYPQGYLESEAARRVELASHTNTYNQLGTLAPSLVDDTRFQRWFQRAERLTSPPDDRLWRYQNAFDADLRDVLGSVRVPTLVVNRKDRAGAAAEQTRYLAEHIDAAKYVEVAGADALPFVGDAGADPRRDRGVPHRPSRATARRPGARDRAVHRPGRLDAPSCAAG